MKGKTKKRIAAGLLSALLVVPVSGYSTRTVLPDETAQAAWAQEQQEEQDPGSEDAAKDGQAGSDNEDETAEDGALRRDEETVRTGVEADGDDPIRDDAEKPEEEAADTQDETTVLKDAEKSGEEAYGVQDEAAVPNAAKAFHADASAGEVTVTVDADAGVIPADARLVVRKADKGEQDEVETAVEGSSQSQIYDHRKKKRPL